MLKRLRKRKTQRSRLDVLKNMSIGGPETAVEKAASVCSIINKDIRSPSIALHSRPEVRLSVCRKYLASRRPGRAHKKSVPLAYVAYGTPDKTAHIRGHWKFLIDRKMT